MASSKELRTQIASIEKISKITKAMENVAASKMRRARERMLTSMAYASKIREVMRHVASSNCDYEHPYLRERNSPPQRVGYIVVSTDRGLCGGLNLNLFKLVMEHAEQLQQSGIESEWCLLGKRAELFFRKVPVSVVAQIDNLGDNPGVVKLLGAIKIMLDSYRQGTLDQLWIAHNIFVTTLVQRPVVELLLPLEREGCTNHQRSYLYEPAPQELLNTLMTRYIETQVYQAVVDNIACEQVARMVAMRGATDNSQEIIRNLALLYNKARQAVITREISEVVGGADAV